MAPGNPASEFDSLYRPRPFACLNSPSRPGHENPRQSRRAHLAKRLFHHRRQYFQNEQRAAAQLFTTSASSAPSDLSRATRLASLARHARHSRGRIRANNNARLIDRCTRCCDRGARPGWCAADTGGVDDGLDPAWLSRSAVASMRRIASARRPLLVASATITDQARPRRSRAGDVRRSSRPDTIAQLTRRVSAQKLVH
jgi:hypothetical protein